ncbi:MAG: DUF1109 domain-containing protein [Amaricoccus sp.]
MRTEHLIAAMAADLGRERPVEAMLPWALLAAALVVGAACLLLLGPRPDLASALGTPRVLLKQGFPVLLAVGGFGWAERLARPAAPSGPWPLLLGAVPILLGGAVLATLDALPRAGWCAATLGQTHLDCLASISLMALPILVASLATLRRGASLRPALTGAAAGLASGGTAAALYAIHCVEDSPLFYATWYGIAILGATALGALAGARLLRW